MEAPYTRVKEVPRKGGRIAESASTELLTAIYEMPVRVVDPDEVRQQAVGEDGEAGPVGWSQRRC
jgi:hypothetical protein